MVTRRESHEVDDVTKRGGKMRADRRREAIESCDEGSHRCPLPRFSDPDQRTEDHAEVVGHDSDEVALADLDQAPDPCSPRTTSGAHVREAALDDFRASALQLLALVAQPAPPVL